MVKRRFHIFLKHQIQGLFRPDSLKFKDPTWHRFRLRESFIFTVTTMRICVAYLLSIYILYQIYFLKCVCVCVLPHKDAWSPHTSPGRSCQPSEGQHFHRPKGMSSPDWRITEKRSHVTNVPLNKRLFILHPQRLFKHSSRLKQL